LRQAARRISCFPHSSFDRLFGILDLPSAIRVIPEFQHLSVGDKIHLGPREELTVITSDTGRALVLGYNAHGFEWVWQFGLYTLDGNRTRLVTRGTERFRHTVTSWLLMRVMEPAAFIMTRRMLLGVKQRAEALKAAGTGGTRANRQAA